MQIQQLSLFPEYETQKPTTKTKQSPKPTMIETSCSTKRAANLLQISTTTLIRAKQQGRLPYKQGAWMVNFVGKKGKKRLFWAVSFNR
jgi:hypothetical protein